MMREFSLLSLWLCSVIKYTLKPRTEGKNMKYSQKKKTLHIFVWLQTFVESLMHTRACLLKETGTYTLSSERIIETEGEINIQLLCRAYLLYYSLLRNFCVVFPLLLFKSPCLSICLFPQSISPFSEFTKDDNFGITLSIPSTERETTHSAEY